MALVLRHVTKTANVTITTNGRGNSSNSNKVVDVPALDAPAVGDQAMAMMWVGATADRPTFDRNRANWPPPMMYDTTVSKVIFWVPGSNPTVWVDITGAVA